jgi:hemerythrin-like domain-containing protein
MLMLAQLLKKNAPPYKGVPQTPVGRAEYAIGLFTNLIEKHFAIEESYVFPLLSGTEKLDTLIVALKNEHKLLREQFQQLNPDKPDVALMDALGHLLEQHIRKEEREYFQEAQRAKDELFAGLSLPIEDKEA